MVAGRFKSGSKRKVAVRTPGGKKVIHYRERKPKQASCALTGEPLMGTPRQRPAKMQAMTKSKKRPTRPFGGVLSSRAMRFVFIAKAREQE